MIDMNLELDILKFIEYSGRIKKDNLKTLYLWASSEANQKKTLEAIEKSEFNQIIDSLIEKNYLINEEEIIFVNNDIIQQLTWWEDPMKNNVMKNYNFELLWIGKFIISGSPDCLRIILKRIEEELKQSSFVQIDTATISETTKKAKFSLRIYGIDTSFTFDRNSFIIKSKSTIGDIPNLANEPVEHPINNLSKDPDEIALQIAPNTAVNFYLLNMIKTILKNTCDNFKLHLDISELSKTRGVDTGHD